MLRWSDHSLSTNHPRKKIRHKYVEKRPKMQKMTAWTYDGARVGSGFYQYTSAPPLNISSDPKVSPSSCQILKST